jgi:3-methyladenine DNA glycosylase AlkD
MTLTRPPQLAASFVRKSIAWMVRQAGQRTHKNQYRHLLSALTALNLAARPAPKSLDPDSYTIVVNDRA